MYILGLLCHVATLDLNVATFQRRNVAASRRQFDPSLESRNVRYPRRDVGLALLFNVVTLDIHITTLIITILWNVATLPRMSRRWKIPSLESRDVASERHDIASERRDVALFKAKHRPFFLFLPCITLA